MTKGAHAHNQTSVLLIHPPADLLHQSLSHNSILAVLGFRHYFASAVSVDDQKRSGLVVLAASIIACIRLKGMDIKPSPKLNATVRDSVHLAQVIVEAVERRG